jgi:hypothetical protein
MADVRVDPLLSYARRDGRDLTIVLVVDAGDLSPGAELSLLLRADDAIEVPVTVTAGGEDRRRVEARVSGDQLHDGTWRMKLVEPTGQRRNLQTRVVVRSDMPVALLTGRPPRTRLPEPTPRG